MREMEMVQKIKIGTRGSALALVQTDEVIRALHKRYPELETERVVLRTKGDKILDKPLLDFGGKGAFITEFEEALLNGRIDLAVHSAKDMPMELADGLVLAGTLPRADARDVLVMRKGVLAGQAAFMGQSVQHGASPQETGGMKKETKVSGFVIGTGSLRRQFQLKRLFPDAVCVNIRGNVQTRLQKILDGQCDGVILAAAGLERLGLMEEKEFDYRCFSYEDMLPAGGQGIIAMESRQEEEIMELVKGISDWNAYMELETERRVLQLLDAGCQEAIGVIAQVEDDRIFLKMLREKNGVITGRQGQDTAANHLKLADTLVGQE